MKDSARLSKELLEFKEECAPSAVGHRICFYPENWDDDKPTVYLLCSETTYAAIFKGLFYFADHFQTIQIVFVELEAEEKWPEDVVKNCVLKDHHTLIVITEDIKHSLDRLIDHYEKLEEPFNTAHITDGSQDFLTHFKQYGQDGSSTYATDYTEMGCQLQLIAPERINELDNNQFDHYRLGPLKKRQRDWEPILRNHHICLFDTNAIKKAEFRAKKNNNPSGFSSEQAIQLIRYAMVSPKMSFLFLYHIQKEHKLDPTSATWVSQALWYGIHGADNRAYEKPFNNDNLLEFLIDNKLLEYPLSFIKSKKTGRWWVKIPTPSSGYQDDIYFPCTETDFKESRKGHFPNRIIRALSRVQDV